MRCEAFTPLSPAGNTGFMSIFLNPTASGWFLMPARSSYIHMRTSPRSITWLREFIAGSAVSPFHSSQIVVAPRRIM